MKTRVLSLLGPCVLAALGVVACEPASETPVEVPLDEIERTIIEALCEVSFSCDCTHGRYYETERSCELDAAVFADELRALPQQFPLHDLSYDPRCLGIVAEQLDALGCNSVLPEAEAEDEPACEVPCHYFHGTKTLGQSCEIYGNEISDCAQGLRCSADRCIDPCSEEPIGTLAGSGESCWYVDCREGLQCTPDTSICAPLPKAGEPCPWGACVEGAVCDFGTEEPVCVTIPGVGELCPQGACEEGSFCEAEDLSNPMSDARCFLPRALAEPCRGHRQCQSSYCPAGFCEQVPGEGESCAGVNLCAQGLDCIDEVCALADALLCQAGVPYLGY